MGCLEYASGPRAFLHLTIESLAQPDRFLLTPDLLRSTKVYSVGRLSRNLPRTPGMPAPVTDSPLFKTRQTRPAGISSGAGSDHHGICTRLARIRTGSAKGYSQDRDETCRSEDQWRGEGEGPVHGKYMQMQVAGSVLGVILLIDSQRTDRLYMASQTGYRRGLRRRFRFLAGSRGRDVTRAFREAAGVWTPRDRPVG